MRHIKKDLVIFTSPQGRSSPSPVVQLYIHKQLLVFMTIPCWLDLQSGWCCGSVLFSMGQRTHHTEPLWACPLWEGGCMVRKGNSNAGNIFVIQVTQNRSLYCITTPQIQSIDSLKKPTQGLSLLVVLLVQGSPNYGPRAGSGLP